MKIAVTGATGHLGSQIVAALNKKTAQDNIIALVHNKNHAQKLTSAGFQIREMDFQNEDSLQKALTGVDVLVYIASKTYTVLDRVKELENVLAAMKQAKVNKLVAMSFIADQEDNPFVMSPFYGYLPRRLAGTDLDYVILKNALYADPLVPYLPELIARKGLIYPVGRETMSFITIKDSAEAFACATTSPALLSSRTTYLLAQTEPLTMPELGAIMSRVTGHEIGYNPVSVKKFGEIYASEGDGSELASMYACGAMGYLKGQSKAFKIITGHEPESMESFLKRSYHD